MHEDASKELKGRTKCRRNSLYYAGYVEFSPNYLIAQCWGDLMAGEPPKVALWHKRYSSVVQLGAAGINGQRFCTHSSGCWPGTVPLEVRWHVGDL